MNKGLKVLPALVWFSPQPMMQMHVHAVTFRISEMPIAKQHFSTCTDRYISVIHQDRWFVFLHWP